ncbi:MAG: hypothetical protein OXM61_16750 [Candidatus Poribacteria bacterium]|nr:hypothetical protein [Candidatus Poribacteria bacterium]
MAFTNQGTLTLQNFATVASIADTWQRAFADGERIYHASNGKLNVWDYRGNHKPDESFDIVSDKVGGLTKVGNNFYILFSYDSVRLVNSTRYYGAIAVYSESGVAGEGFPVIPSGGNARRPAGLVWNSSSNVFVVGQQGITSGFTNNPDLRVYNASGVEQGSARALTPPASNKHLWNLLLDQDGGVLWCVFMGLTPPPDFHAYDLNYVRSQSDDVAGIRNPYSVTFDGDYILSVVATTTFYGDTPFELPDAPVAPISRKQFTGFERYTENYDYFKVVDSALTIRKRNVPTFIQTTTREVDLSSSVTISKQLDSWTLIPQDTIPDAEVGDIIAPSVPDVNTPAATDYPAADRFEITGFNTTGGKEIYFQRILAERSS